MPEFGNLKSIDLRRIWPREDENFTPWLFKKENLTRLADVLNIKLKPMKKEMEVGQFHADIVCRNTADNSLVVIENQLEETDHDHLGKVLTYAAALRASTVIWVAAEFASEHSNALNWLNENMSDHFQFFGVKLELIQVDNSRPTPKFTIIAKPNNWIRPVIEGDSRTRFWSKFHEHLTESNSSLDPQGPSENPQYFGFRIGEASDIWLAAWRHQNNKFFGVNLHLKGQNAQLYFDKLKEQQNEIETELDAALEWKKSPSYNPSVPQVGLYKTMDSPEETDWPNQFKWLRLNLEKLDRVFRPRVANF